MNTKRERPPIRKSRLENEVILAVVVLYVVLSGALLTAFVIAGNTLLRPLVNAINRIPIDEQASEATYEVRVVAEAEAMPTLRERLVDELEAAHYPVGVIDQAPHGDEQMELVATLVSTAVDARELEAVVQRLARLPGVAHAAWESSTRD